MTHPNDIVLSMHADAALPAAEAATVSLHLEGCTICAAKVAVAQGETRIIAAAFAADAGEALPELSIPTFTRPAGLREFALANLATALLIWMAGFLWKTLFGELVVNAAELAASAYAPDTYDLVSASITHYLEEGTSMFSTYVGFVCFAVTAVALVLWGIRHRKGGQLASLGIAAVLCAGVVVSEPASALDVRYDKTLVTIAADETVDDTLLIAAETVFVRGNVTGDLLVVGRRIEIDGNVEGNVVAFAESVTVRGSVGGSLLSAAERVELREATTGSDLWAAAETVSIDMASRVEGNAALAGEKTLVAGYVGKDLYAMAETVELDGSLGASLEALANRVRLLDGAHVGGDARLRIDSDAKLYRADGAQVDGGIEFLAKPDTAKRKNRYTDLEFYLWQLARLVSAVLVGICLLWLFPAWRSLSISSGIEGLKSAGIGLAALVGLPLLALVVAFTLVGLPFSFFAIVAWLLVLYVAKILVGVFVGRSLLARTDYADSSFLILLVGIALVILVVNLPWVGGLLGFLMTIVGMGVMVQWLLGVVPRATYTER